MGENVRLANIYIKIYNKRSLTMDDLAFLAKYDPECFEKTCHNLVYNVPETKKLMQPETSEQEEKNTKSQEAIEPVPIEPEPEIDLQAELPAEPEEPKSDTIEALLENIKKMDGQEFGIQKVSMDHVKHLLGSLFMEMLFPHNDREKTFEMAEDEIYSIFNKKV